MYPLDASPKPSIQKTLKNSVGNARGDTEVLASAPDLASPTVVIIDNLLGAGPSDNVEAAHETEDTVNNFDIDAADMPEPWSESLWPYGNWIDGLEVIDPLPPTWV
jgi:hypothetical protein